MPSISFVRREPIQKGWSDDKKYRIRDEKGNSYLLRLSHASQYEGKKREFFNMKQAAALGVPMCQPLDFGLCEEGVYSIQSWIDGVEAEAIMETFPKEKQYRYGWEAGQALRKIHSIPSPPNTEDWENRFNRKIDRKIRLYQDCPLEYDNGGGEALIRCLNTNRHLLKNRPQCWQHGDFHIGNMMLDQDGRLQIIDFDCSDFGDPWEEFNRIVWSAQKAPVFASGTVDGYFEGNVPEDFWRLLALYIASNTLSSLPWAIPFGQQEIDTMQRQAQQVLSWYNHMQNSVPSWYHSLDSQ